MTDDPRSLYRSRRLSAGYPGLGARSLEWYQADVARRPDETPRIQQLLACLDRLLDVRSHPNFLVVGCGPQPESMRLLSEMGFNAVGVEPVPLFISAARSFLGDEEAVSEGRAEDLPNEDGSQHVVLLESVLKQRRLGRHDTRRSPARSGSRRCRVRHNDEPAPSRTVSSGVQRPLLSATPKRREGVVRLPTPPLRPITRQLHGTAAVHWFTFAELCNRGRAAGFTRFYSHLDLKTPDPSSFLWSHRRLKAQPSQIQKSPWLRALALTQQGGAISMVKT